MNKNQENLVNSTMEILHSIATKFEPTGKEKHTFISQLISNFDHENWNSWKFISQILINTVFKIDNKKGNILLDDTLTQIFVQIYQKVIIKTEPLLENMNGNGITKEEFTSIPNIL